ncbi:putative phage abortive infection protein [Bacillus paranthracis]|uniref:putative phage abortive infection protein n=1 Tax=Bacillus paranthracis TaxID=2026186 RepID=UPI001E471EBA|nr:putative phage abortive infection protein [Bacillus paranthracis]MCC2536563.1 putative phage abortive infection protein [Bacillus paranthracis]
MCKKAWTKFKELFDDYVTIFLVVVGIVLFVVATKMPFKVYEYFVPKIVDYKDVRDLGPVGDFIGGTTVAFLTAASTVFLLATIIMQRKEIKISQQSIEELVKQTKTSATQAEEARKEAKITNETMKKQQFETTFFNMVTLHRNSVDRLKIGDVEGNEAIESCLQAFRDEYFTIANFEFKKFYETDDYNEIVGLFTYLNTKEVPGIEEVQISSEVEVLSAFHKLDFRDVKKFQKDNKMIKEFIDYAYVKPDEKYIDEAYYRFHLKYDSILGGYFNSITTIIKFLQESPYEMEDRENNKQNNKIYRKIFFSQFSPSEMMMLYYHAKYLEGNEWLLKELKVYNLFYPLLGETVYLFWPIDKQNIEELSK